MDSSHRDPSNDEAEHRPILKNNQNKYHPRFGFTPKTDISFPKTGFCFYCDCSDIITKLISLSYSGSVTIMQWTIPSDISCNIHTQKGEGSVCLCTLWSVYNTFLCTSVSLRFCIIIFFQIKWEKKEFFTWRNLQESEISKIRFHFVPKKKMIGY